MAPPISPMIANSHFLRWASEANNEGDHGAGEQTVSRHLKVLRDQSLVIPRHEGASVWYSLADERIVEMFDLMRALLRRLLDESTRLAGSLGDGEGAAAPL